MVRGQEFSPREKEYIEAHAYRMSWGAIAYELSVRFPEDNGGERTGRGVQGYATRSKKKKPISRMPVPIATDVIYLARSCGYTKHDLSDILRARLTEILDNTGAYFAETT